MFTLLGHLNLEIKISLQIIEDYLVCLLKQRTLIFVEQMDSNHSSTRSSTKTMADEARRKEQPYNYTVDIDIDNDSNVCEKRSSSVGSDKVGHRSRMRTCLLYTSDAADE